MNETASAASAQKPRRRWWRWLLAAYLLLLLASHWTRARQPRVPPPVSRAQVTLQAVAADRQLPQAIQLAYQTFQSAADKPVLVLLHGSPGESGDFARISPALAQHYRLLAPDLPGFGASTHALPDYSFRAHAHYVLQWLDQLHVQRAHFVGFSMGGGVVLSLADLAPERVASLTLLSAIGAQEMELLGDYHLNHALHGLQLAGLWGLRELTPQFGYFDDSMLSVEYARNFYDSDQRPLRGILQRYPGPMQIIQGRDDFLVPAEAGREHYRLVPQSELHLLDSDHFMVFRADGPVAPLLDDFVTRVERGTATTRANAEAARVAQAALPPNPADLPKMMGVASLVLSLLIVAGMFLAADFTALSVGAIIAQGRIGFSFGVIACLFGLGLRAVWQGVKLRQFALAATLARAVQALLLLSAACLLSAVVLRYVAFGQLHFFPKALLLGLAWLFPFQWLSRRLRDSLLKRAR